MTSYTLANTHVDISASVEIGRGGGHLWFPVFYRLDERRILCAATVAEDRPQGEWPATLFLSEDDGRSWCRALDIPCYASGAVLLEPGKLLLQPYELWPLVPQDGCNARAQGTLITGDTKGALRAERTPVQILDFPRPWRINNEAQTLNAAFHPTTIRLKDGRLIGTFYGKFTDEKGFSLCSVTSADDGLTWRYQSVVAGNRVAPEAKEGPNESDMARLPDGRLLCVFRVGARQAFWKTTSGDDGASWSQPAPMTEMGSVLPKLTVLPGGTLLLSGGRDGIFLWICTDGQATHWERIDLVAYHNAHVQEAWRYPESDAGWKETLYQAPTTSYTSMLALGPDEVLLCYDRLANGWDAAPGPFGEHNFLFCVRIRIHPTRKDTTVS